jgi:peptidoglycan/LPS O-acetylase OafA/YrhL
VFVSVLCLPIFALISQYRNRACISDIYQRFFSLKPFVVLSRLTYGAYLAHTMGQLYDQGTLRVPRYLSAYTGVSRPTLACIRVTALN